MPPELFPLAGLLLAVGALAGLTAGLFGIGGGAVMVPALFFALDALGYGSAMHVAVATSTAVIVFNGIRSARHHARRGAVDRDILSISRPWQSWAVGIALGSFLGALLLAPRLSGEVLTLLFALVAVLVAVQLIVGRPDFALRDYVPFGAAALPGGAGIGALSALMGIGGGSLTVPLMLLCRVDAHRAVGTAAAIGVVIAVPATLGYLVSGVGAEGRPPGSVGYVSLPGFALVAGTALLTVPLGVRLAHRLPADRLRRWFGVLLLLVAANMARKAIGGA